MNKRGQGFSWMIVSIIIAVMTLAVFVMIAVWFPFQETIDTTACKESVVLKATLPGDKIPVKEMINLRCKTQKICVTAKSGEGDCTSLGKDFETVRLTASDKGDRETQIKMLISRQMASCWEMLGEGKLEIFSRAWVWNQDFKTQGIICARIEFDKSALTGKDDEYELTSVPGLIEYMISHKVPSYNVSYMDFLRNTPEGQSAREYYQTSLVGSSCSSGASSCSADSSLVDLNLTKNLSIVYVETTRTRAGSLWGMTSLGVLGTGIGALTKSSTIAQVMGLGGTAVGWVAGNTVQDFFGTSLPDGRNSVSGIFLTEYSPEGFKSFNIDSFENIY